MTPIPPPPGAHPRFPQRAQPGRRSARCGVGDGSPRPHPPQPQPMGSGLRPHAQRTGGWARENVQPQTPHTQARGTPPGHPNAAPKRARPARKSAPCGAHNGAPRPHLQHRQLVGSGPRPHARRTGGQVWESAQPRTPHTQAGGAPPPVARVPTQNCAKPPCKSAPVWAW